MVNIILLTILTATQLVLCQSAELCPNCTSSGSSNNAKSNFEALLPLIKATAAEAGVGIGIGINGGVGVGVSRNSTTGKESIGIGIGSNSSSAGYSGGMAGGRSSVGGLLSGLSGSGSSYSTSNGYGTQASTPVAPTVVSDVYVPGMTGRRVPGAGGSSNLAANYQDLQASPAHSAYPQNNGVPASNTYPIRVPPVERVKLVLPPNSSSEQNVESLYSIKRLRPNGSSAFPLQAYSTNTIPTSPTFIDTTPPMTVPLKLPPPPTFTYHPIVDTYVPAPVSRPAPVSTLEASQTYAYGRPITPDTIVTSESKKTVATTTTSPQGLTSTTVTELSNTWQTSTRRSLDGSKTTESSQKSSTITTTRPPSVCGDCLPI